MTWLLDVSALVARLVQNHEHHARVNAWWPNRDLAVCPITELGFLRVACALGSTMADARIVLGDYLQRENPIFIPCDQRALASTSMTSGRKSTDIYLADLAMAHGFRFVTLDEGINHGSADLIPSIVNPTPEP